MKPPLIPLALVCAANLTAAPFPQPSNPPPQITLQWTPAPGTATSKLYYGVGPGQYTNATNLGATNQASVVLPTRGVTYYFAVTDSWTNGLESPFSNEVNYTPMLPPAAPTIGQPLILTVQTKTSPLDFMWTDLFNESIDPGSTNGMFRLQIAQSSGISGQLTRVKRAMILQPPLPK